MAVAYGLFMSDTNQLTDLHTILAALRRGEGSPIESRDAHWAVRDIIADIDDADLDDVETVDALVLDVETRIAECEVAS